MSANAELISAKGEKSYLASTSVETRPGMIFNISVPNSTTNLSSADSACSSIVLQ